MRINHMTATDKGETPCHVAMVSKMGLQHKIADLLHGGDDEANISLEIGHEELKDAIAEIVCGKKLYKTHIPKMTVMVPSNVSMLLTERENGLTSKK